MTFKHRYLQAAAERRGAVLPLAAIGIVFFIAMVAFAIDIGYIAVVRTELQTAADAAALASAAEMYDKAIITSSQASVVQKYKAQQAADQYVGYHKAGGKYLDFLETDLECGYLADRNDLSTFDPTSSFYNAVRVKVKRNRDINGNVNLFFGRALGASDFSCEARSTAWFCTAINGFKGGTGANPKLLPYTIKETDWDTAMATGPDAYARSDSGYVSLGSDGIREVKLFPLDGGGNGNGVTPGNFGTVDIGSSNNSTADIARQILYGPNATDMAHFPNSTLSIGSNGYVTLNGDTGISAGVKDELASIIGKPRIIPLYSQVSGNGNNANYRITRFVGVTVLYVKLTGSLASKHVVVQPTMVVDSTGVPSPTSSTTQFVRRPLQIIQ